MTTDIDPVVAAAELDAIRRVIDTVEHAQNNELPEVFLALFRPDAIWTTGGGKRLYGLDEIAEFTRQVLPAACVGCRCGSSWSTCCSSAPTSPP